MIKFVVHTRALPGIKFTGAPIVLEVEGELVQSLDDPSIMWLPEGEFMFRIMAPEALYESREIHQLSGPPKKEMVPPVYHSHACYWTVHGAMAAAERMVRAGLEFDIRKLRKDEFTEEELAAKIQSLTEEMEQKLTQIQTIMLP